MKPCLTLKWPQVPEFFFFLLQDVKLWCAPECFYLMYLSVVLVTLSVPYSPQFSGFLIHFSVKNIACVQLKMYSFSPSSLLLLLFPFFSVIFWPPSSVAHVLDRHAPPALPTLTLAQPPPAPERPPARPPTWHPGWPCPKTVPLSKRAPNLSSCDWMPPPNANLLHHNHHHNLHHHHHHCSTMPVYQSQTAVAQSGMSHQLLPHCLIRNVEHMSLITCLLFHLNIFIHESISPPLPQTPLPHLHL